ncbi:uncharacterized protein zgc:174888 [Erpetoichthys calabaricus]|uniref:uncharacterized protein zgc:174888 n=1 Tax=Erpetoichthys calabaricus TaxID=27687 RepID=UPI00109FF5F2|nr:uncharacterized protein zgc:174888 [Erpetoichthys calabaricus]
MIYKVFLLSLLLVVEIRGKDHQSVRGLQKNINAEIPVFRTIFPKDYQTVHHYSDSLLCSGDEARCCLLRAIYLLSTDWRTVLSNLWPEHTQVSFITIISRDLEKISKEYFIEDDLDPHEFTSSSSSVENLMNVSHHLLDLWLNMTKDTSRNCHFYNNEENQLHHSTILPRSKEHMNSMQSRHGKRWDSPPVAGKATDLTKRLEIVIMLVSAVLSGTILVH